MGAVGQGSRTRTPIPANDNRVGVVRLDKAGKISNLKRLKPDPVSMYIDYVTTEYLRRIQVGMSEIAEQYIPGTTINTTQWQRSAHGCANPYDRLGFAWARNTTNCFASTIATSSWALYYTPGAPYDAQANNYPGSGGYFISEAGLRDVGRIAYEIAFWSPKPGNVSTNPQRLFIPSVRPAWVSAPMSSPMALPLARPEAVPTPHPDLGVEPANEPNPARNPNPRHRSRPRPNRVRLPRVFPFFRVGDNFPEIDMPGVVVTPNPSSPTGFDVEAYAGNRNYDRAPSRTRNRKPRIQEKFNVAIVGGMVWSGINTVTEVMDFAKAMYDALPRSSQLPWGNKASKSQKVTYMLTNPDVWDDLDLAEAFENYVNMQFGDFVAAIGSDSIKKLYKDLGSATGLDRAVNAGRNISGDIELTEEQQRDLVNPVPQLDIDGQTGEVTITGPLGVFRVGNFRSNPLAYNWWSGRTRKRR